MKFQCLQPSDLLLIQFNTNESDAEGREKEKGTQTSIFSETKAAKKKDPETQENASEDKETDTFDYFAHPQSQDIDMFLVIILSSHQNIT